MNWINVSGQDSITNFILFFTLCFESVIKKVAAAVDLGSFCFLFGIPEISSQK
jgi:hypothetical protein